jgi:hypothetical protein
MFLITHLINYFKPYDKNKPAKAVVEVAALNLADLTITLVAIFALSATEANPLMAFILNNSLFLFCLLKLATSYFLYEVRNQKFSAFSLFGISLDLVVYRSVIVWNILTMIQKLLGF